MTTGSQLLGARWPRFNCVQIIETMSRCVAEYGVGNTACAYVFYVTLCCTMSRRCSMLTVVFDLNHTLMHVSQPMSM